MARRGVLHAVGTAANGRPAVRVAFRVVIIVRLEEWA